MCFAIKRGEIETRFDAKYLALRKSYHWHYPSSILASLVVEEPTYGAPSRAIRMITGLEPRYIRITDFSEDGIEESHEFLTAEDSDDRYLLSENDLLFARSGATVGKTYLHEDVSKPAVFAGYCIRFRLRPTIVLPKFVYFFTKTLAYKHWTSRIQRPAGQPNINKEEFKSLEIPVPPNKVQQSLVRQLQSARAGRDAKLTQADELLRGVDKFVLECLQIELPVASTKNIFAIQARSMRDGSRANADFFHPERILTLRAIASIAQRLPCRTLSEIVRFERDQVKTPIDNYVGLANVQSHTGELVHVDEEVSGTSSLFKQNDVLFARLRPYLNKVYRAERDGCCSTEFHVLRMRNPHELLPDYLAVVLRSTLVLSQTKHMMTGNTHPRLTNEDVVKLVVPLPPMDIQQEIVSEVRRRREQSRRLKSEAQKEWEAAKESFEQQLLTGTE